jgi:asparagine synthase (glutamine-hydrolysing)
MSKYIQERGPDHTGFHIDKSLGLVHTRLSIIDLKSHANQPMIKNNISLVFNGEIYNYITLKEELIKSGCNFNTNSDTEVIIEGYKVWGINKLLVKCNGMFAFAINDKSIETTYIVRDRFGQKPIYYANIQDAFFFASDIRAIAKLNKPNLNIDMESVEYFLTELSMPQPKTIWREIEQIKPAHYLEVQNETITEKLYWQLDFHDKITKYNSEEIIQITEQKLTDAIMKRTVSDVPIGCFLSGGVDSGLVTSILAQNTTTQIKTFSVGLDYEKDNELHDARIVAKKI